MLERVGTLETSSSCTSLSEFSLLPKNPSERGTPFVIGVAGGASSGKQTVCQMIMDRLLERDSSIGVKVVIIKMEDFYRELSGDDAASADAGTYNFDHPNAVDFALLEECLEDILHGRPADIPQYDFQNNKRLAKTVRIDRPDVVIFSGIFMLYKRRVRDALNLRVFVDVDSDVRLARQVVRDTEVRYERNLETVLQSYLKYVKPSFEDFILPSKKFADVIIPRGEENTIAIDLLTQHIVDILEERGSQAAEVEQAKIDVRSSTTVAALARGVDKFGSLPQ
ncbi:uridine kinase [Powellomyces hirtus]|uniref:uridine/cytidine kinase n=1 Tax=Powellomyces hirtus TaxID=109895 RepID=A0A507DYF9_9FUNG|nr:uridine kinase [Powellomyces hirtus]